MREGSPDLNSREASSESFWSRCSGKTARDRRNLTVAVRLTAGWALLFISAVKLIDLGVVTSRPLVWLVALLPCLLAALVVWGWARFLRDADELQRQIHLQAMAVGFGGTWLMVAIYTMFENAGAPTARVSDAMLFLALFYSIGVIRGSLRYR